MSYADSGLEVLSVDRAPRATRSGLRDLPVATGPTYDRMFVPAGANYGLRVAGNGVSPEWLAVKNFVSEHKTPVAIAGASILGLLLYSVFAGDDSGDE